MKQLKKIFGFIQIMVTLYQTNVMALEEKSTSSFTLADFSIKLHSKEISEIGDHISVLKDVTRKHMDAYLLKRISSDGKYEYETITLTTKAFSTQESGNRLRKLVSETYISTIHYKGLIFFKSKSVPTIDYVQQLQKEAFIGQAKLNFLSAIHVVSSVGDPLYSIDDVVFSFDSQALTKGQSNTVKSKNDVDITTTVIVGAAIGVSSVLCIITFYLLWSRKKSKKFYACEGEPPSTMMDKSITKELRLDIPELKAASTGPLSSSPDDSSMGSSKFTYNNIQSDGGHSVSLNTRTETKSFNSGGTIDLSQVDVNVWRRNHIAEEEPFEADVTKISESSPNKTIEMGGGTAPLRRPNEPFNADSHHFEVRIKDNTRQSGSSYLSTDNLNQFDENRRNMGFGAHSARYQERVYGRHPHVLSRHSSRSIHRRENEVVQDLNLLSQEISRNRSPEK